MIVPVFRSERRSNGGLSAQQAQQARPAQRHGFSLIEVMVAIVMLAIVLTSLTALSIVLSHRVVRNAGQAYETGILTQEIDRAVAVPVESLAVRLGQTTIDTPVTTPWPIQRRVSISGRADSLTVTVTINPLNSMQRADSVSQSVLRTR